MIGRHPLQSCAVLRQAPEIIAHRGTPREHVENTLAGFAHALAGGADALELDVHLTADGVPVVYHDAEFGPAAGRHAGMAIVSLPHEDVRAIVLAPGVAVPMLAEVLDLARGRATVYVEVKAADAERQVAAAVTPFGAAAPVHSFDHRIALRVRELSAATPVGILSTSYLIDSVAALHAAHARDLWQHWTMIDAALVEAVHAAGGRVIAWTVNDAALAARLAALGVDGLCTDLPREMRAALG